MMKEMIHKLMATIAELKNDRSVRAATPATDNTANADTPSPLEPVDAANDDGESAPKKRAVVREHPALKPELDDIKSVLSSIKTSLRFLGESMALVQSTLAAHAAARCAFEATLLTPFRSRPRFLNRDADGTPSHRTCRLPDRHVSHIRPRWHVAGFRLSRPRCRSNPARREWREEVERRRSVWHTKEHIEYDSTGTTAELTDVEIVAKVTAEQPNENAAEMDPASADDAPLPTSPEVIAALALVRRHCGAIEGTGLSLVDRLDCIEDAVVKHPIANKKQATHF
ncbi:hypothetical protein HPB49_007426 [Dermacentor silvarum]|uniref:Uncharacterized protein n=1 Tax=Dermacentor silvarum TaxID=543639 RepID=A0ACB8DX47_DERSI|nr:hypothetical protein HPB49_007426 [Dermacentor silvarum]